MKFYPVKKLILIFLITTLPHFLTAQEVQEEISVDSGKNVDLLYREDQFYVGLTYNILTKKPYGIFSKGFSGGFHLGFLRDFPLNERRNVALAIGAGYGYDKYGSNFKIVDTGGEITYSIIDPEIDYDTNRFVTHQVEIPLEFRWRTSTPESYKFWRIYGGVKTSYIFLYTATYREGSIKEKVRDIPHFNRLQYTAFLNFGWNTFNFQVQYLLNPLFDSDARYNDSPVETGTLKIGLMFYIL